MAEDKNKPTESRRGKQMDPTCATCGEPMRLVTTIMTGIGEYLAAYLCEECDTHRMLSISPER
jgi:hypothetical protein